MADLFGFEIKRKQDKSIESKPSIKENLQEQFGAIITPKAFGNKNQDTKVNTGPKRWSGSGLTEYEEQKINEGPAYEWSKVYSNAEKAYMQFQKAIDELGRYTTKKTGEKTDQKIFEKQWKKQVVPFYQLMKSWIRGKL